MPATSDPSPDDRAERTGADAPTRTGRGRSLALFAVVAAVVVALGLAALTRAGNEDAAAVAGGQTTTGGNTATGPAAYGPVTGTERRDAGDPFALGRADAPVVMVEYADYTCPFCAKFANDTLPELVRRYVDRGVLRIEWRDFAIFGEDAERAARAGRAAAAQGRFWQFNRALYALAPPSGHPAMPLAKLVQVARDAGVRDIARFRRDLAADATQQAVETDRDQGLAIGVNSTPSFIINGFPLSGAQPIEAFAEVIERAHAAAPGR